MGFSSSRLVAGRRSSPHVSTGGADRSHQPRNYGRKQTKTPFGFHPHSSRPIPDPPRRVCVSGKMIVPSPVPTPPLQTAKLLDLMNANCLILFRFAHLICFKVATSRTWEAKVKIIGLSRKTPRQRRVRPPPSPHWLLCFITVS